MFEKLITRQVSTERPVHHPCLPSGASTAYKGVEMVGDGDYKRCAKLIQKLFPPTPCVHASCSFGGAYQPPLPAVVYGFSYMYDRTAAIGLLDRKPAVFGEQSMSAADIEGGGVEVCALSAQQTAERFAGTTDAAKANNYCALYIYIYSSHHYKINHNGRRQGEQLLW